MSICARLARNCAGIAAAAVSLISCGAGDAPDEVPVEAVSIYGIAGGVVSPIPGTFLGLKTTLASQGIQVLGGYCSRANQLGAGGQPLPSGDTSILAIFSIQQLDLAKALSTGRFAQLDQRWQLFGQTFDCSASGF